MRLWLGLLLGFVLVAATSVARGELIGVDSKQIGCKATPPGERKPLLPPPERDVTEPIPLQIQPVDWYVPYERPWCDSPDVFLKAPPIEKYTSILSSHWGYYDVFVSFTYTPSVSTEDFWAIDNIEVTSIDAAGLPEPTSLILLVSGALAGLAWLRRAKGRRA